MWDDQHLPNIDFSLICSTVLQGAYTVQDVNQLEKQVATPATSPSPLLSTPPSRLVHTFAPPGRRPAVVARCAEAHGCRRQFLELIEYNVSVSASLYASYYFELRTLCEKAEGERGVTFKPLSEAQQRKLELTSGSSGKELTGDSAEKQHKFKSTTALFDSES